MEQENGILSQGHRLVQLVQQLEETIYLRQLYLVVFITLHTAVIDI